MKYPVSYCWLWLKNCIASILNLQTEQHFSGNKTSYLHLTCTVIWGGQIRVVRFVWQQIYYSMLFYSHMIFEPCCSNLQVNLRVLLAWIWYIHFILQGLFPVPTPPQVCFFMYSSVFLPHFRYLHPLSVLTKLTLKVCFPGIVQYLLFSPDILCNLAAIKLVLLFISHFQM